MDTLLQILYKEIRDRELNEILCKEAKDDEKRIELFYDVIKQRPLIKNKNPNNGKDLQVAERAKEIGNEYFKNKNLSKALDSYNDGIIKCPQEKESNKEILTLLIANRSATYFELKEYQKAINDIKYIFKIGLSHYPQHLNYKIFTRKAKCYDALQDKKSSSEAYNKALNYLKYSKLDKETIKSKEKEIKNVLSKKCSNKQNKLLSLRNKNKDQSEIRFVGGPKYVALHPNVTIKKDPQQGRYAVATEDIEIGTVILEEKAYCAVLDFKYALKYCQYCIKKVDQPIACPKCANVVFCSIACEKQANKTFHKVECSIFKTLSEYEHLKNMYLSLRILTQNHYNFFIDKKEKLRRYLKDKGEKNVPRKKTYESDDYDNLFFLCRNENLLDKKTLFCLLVSSIEILRILKKTNYFPYVTKDEQLTDDEKFIGSLILRHCQITYFNSFGLYKMENGKLLMIGSSIHLTASLFNHSCDENTMRRHAEDKLIMRIRKPLKAGDIIYASYGPSYIIDPKESRQEHLKKYYFDCTCTPCTEDWPTFQIENSTKFQCKSKNCNSSFVVKFPYNFIHMIFTCENCKETTLAFINDLNDLKDLAELQQKANGAIIGSDFEVAVEMYIQILEILYKHLKSPKQLLMYFNVLLNTMNRQLNVSNR